MFIIHILYLSIGSTDFPGFPLCATFGTESVETVNLTINEFKVFMYVHIIDLHVHKIWYNFCMINTYNRGLT